MSKLPPGFVAHQFKKGDAKLPPSNLKGTMAGKSAGISKPQDKAIAPNPAGSFNRGSAPQPTKMTLKGQNAAGSPGVARTTSPHGDPSPNAPQSSAMKHRVNSSGSVAMGVPMDAFKGKR